MIETVILNYLQEHLDVGVFLEAPVKEPSSYILIERLGGGTDNNISSALFAFQSYASSLAEAAKLNYKVIDILENIIELDEITKMKLNTTYNYSDTARKRYRYQAVFDVKFY